MLDSRALVVGYGRMGRLHAKVLRDLGYTVTTVDPDPATGADHPTIAQASLEKHLLDVAAIATPAELLVESAFQLGGTPMLVEKPFATSHREGLMLAAYLKNAGAPVCVGLIERFNPKVRVLKRGSFKSAHFTRWNDRPSPDVTLDLLTHDIDLMHHLGLDLSRTTFDVKAAQPERVRRIDLVTFDDEQITVDLMDHDQSPLHALWHAFLSGKPVPTPRDALRAAELAPYAAALPVAA